MDYIHIKNLEKYNPGYTDRKHIWAKIYWEIFLDESFQALNEIDRYRLISLIVFEVYTSKPVALTPTNLTLLGWDSKKRSISLTLQMLHTFLSDTEECNVEESRVEESRVEESRGEYSQFEKLTLTSWNSLCSQYPTLKAVRNISAERRGHLKKRFANKDFKNNWQVILDTIPQYSFLLGENDRKWAIDYDWLIKNDTNYVKVLEGKYSTTKDGIPQSMKQFIK